MSLVFSRILYLFLISFALFQSSKPPFISLFSNFFIYLFYLPPPHFPFSFLFHILLPAFCYLFSCYVSTFFFPSTSHAASSLSLLLFAFDFCLFHNFACYFPTLYLVIICHPSFYRVRKDYLFVTHFPLIFHRFR